MSALVPPSPKAPPRLRSLTSEDIGILVRHLNQELQGTAFDRAIVPERRAFISGYLKNEWSLRFRSRQTEHSLLVSVRPQSAWVALLAGKGPRACEKATRSGFDLALNKVLDGLKVSEVVQQPEDRILTIWFSSQGRERAFGIVLTLFPALPEALLIEGGPGPDYPVLGRTRAGNDQSPVFHYPTPGQIAPQKRSLPEDLTEWSRTVESHRLEEALFERRTRLGREIRSLLKNSEKRLKQIEEARLAALAEPEYERWGDLMKASLGQIPPIDPENHRALMDWETGQTLRIPCDPRLGPTQQVTRFYELAKRKQRRLKESDNRRSELERRREHLQALESELTAAPLESLLAMEQELGIGTESASESGKIWAGFEGRIFFSREGLPILVGRSKEENLELTFRFARGNDLWFHVRGKPGAHVVVPLRTKRHAALETLLDAACLAVYYSGGEKWGKTEVDYTQKKHVKRIRDSSEASYTQNKTLLVEVDPERLKRLKAD